MRMGVKRNDAAEDLFSIGSAEGSLSEASNPANRGFVPSQFDKRVAPPLNPNAGLAHSHELALIDLPHPEPRTSCRRETQDKAAPEQPGIESPGRKAEK